jgi:hypothetical protein
MHRNRMPLLQCKPPSLPQGLHGHKHTGVAWAQTVQLAAGHQLTLQLLLRGFQQVGSRATATGRGVPAALLCLNCMH